MNFIEKEFGRVTFLKAKQAMLFITDIATTGAGLACAREFIENNSCMALVSFGITQWLDLVVQKFWQIIMIF